MADDDQQQTTSTTSDGPDDNRIPRSRLNSEIEKRKTAEKRLADLEARFGELEDKDKPEIERLSRDLERAAKRAEEAEQRAQQIEAEASVEKRRAVVTEAAARLKFRDPSDASRFVDLNEIEDAATAERALKAVVKTKDYLVTPDTPEPRGLERVLSPGTAGVAAQTPQRELTPDEARNVAHAQLAADALAKIGRPLTSADQ